jgi:superfamily II DNA or RNA helicase
MAKPDLAQKIEIPSAHNWRTTDADEINRRRLRAQEQDFSISNLDPRFPIFSNFRVSSGSGMVYQVEIRDLASPQFSCDCVDFRINGLGTCKHVEAVLLHLRARFRRLFKAATEEGSPRFDVVPETTMDSLRLLPGPQPVPKVVNRWFDSTGQLRDCAPEAALAELERVRQTELPALRISQEVQPWLERRTRLAERKELRRQYELKVQSGEWPVQETTVPLFPYQREGMLHLAFTERALLADEMGLGKTIQAIAACALLHRLGKAQRVLVVTPASLKTEWEDQIQRFTPLPYQLVYGARPLRLKAYAAAPFFTIVNYEQMVLDSLDVNARLQPDVVVLDEAQRIKNWSTKTAQAIKRLKSRYAFVLTGTPIENRIDEIHSLMDFLDPAVLGPLFRFNRDFYDLDDRGRPVGYRNLDQLHARIKPYMLRRRKADVETELPDRTDRNHFVPLSAEQQSLYTDHALQVSRLSQLAERRPLTQQEQEKLQRELAMCRMICDTNYILDPKERACPKLAELERILEECRDNSEVKVLIFSEWERMLELVRELCRKMELGHAWHTGTVPQKRRRAEINLFKTDPDCRVFLSTDSGSTGLNLQNASVVINCDLPWNPARLEQRIARAWRKHQTRSVTVINLVSENTIEHRMIETLATEQALAESVLDLKGNLKEMKIRGGRQAFLARLQQLMAPVTGAPAAPAAPRPKTLPTDRALAFSQLVQEKINGALVRCEERYPADGPHSVLFVVVDRDAPLWRERLQSVHQDLFGPGQADPLAPTHLEVIDRATDEALQRLMASGLIAKATRAIRPLFPTAPETGGPPPLTEEEKSKAAAHRQAASRKLRMARVLGTGDFLEEARAAILDAIQPLARALAVENRLPEPASLEDALLPPLSHTWGEALGSIRQFVNEPAHPWPPVLEDLDKL